MGYGAGVQRETGRIVFIDLIQVGDALACARPVGNALADFIQVLGVGEAGNDVLAPHALNDSAFPPNIKNL